MIYGSGIDFFEQIDSKCLPQFIKFYRLTRNIIMLCDAKHQLTKT